MNDDALTGLACPLPTSRILSRIYIQEDGNLVVTDLWDEVRELLEGPVAAKDDVGGNGL